VFTTVLNLCIAARAARSAVGNPARQLTTRVRHRLLTIVWPVPGRDVVRPMRPEVACFVEARTWGDTILRAKVGSSATSLLGTGKKTTFVAQRSLRSLFPDNPMIQQAWSKRSAVPQIVDVQCHPPPSFPASSLSGASPRGQAA
jgi:hypothetical protein